MQIDVHVRGFWPSAQLNRFVRWRLVALTQGARRGSECAVHLERQGAGQIQCRIVLACAGEPNLVVIALREDVVSAVDAAVERAVDLLDGTRPSQPPRRAVEAYASGTPTRRPRPR